MTTQADTPSPAGPLTIDVVSDVVCPWCYVGKRRLDKALQAFPDAEIDVRWRPFQLDPTIPPGGLDRRAYLADKFSDEGRIKEIHRKLVDLGRDLGIDFAFDKIRRAPNTLDAHRLLRWAAGSEQTGLAEALFHRYFVEGDDLGDRTTLAQVAAACRMDAEAVTERLATDSDATAVREEIDQAVRLGVSGVPFFIFGSKFAVPGAQDSDVLIAAIDEALRDSTPSVRSA